MSYFNVSRSVRLEYRKREMLNIWQIAILVDIRAMFRTHLFRYHCRAAFCKHLQLWLQVSIEYMYIYICIYHFRVCMTIHSHFTMIKYRTYSKMAGCSVKGCSKRSEHGYIVLRFPRDCARRQLWAKNCSLSNYDSNKYYFICEVCFPQSIFILWVTYKYIAICDFRFISIEINGSVDVRTGKKN